MPQDYSNDLVEFCTQYKIQLIGEYTNVKNQTPIYFKCSQCQIQVKKSYKTLTKYKDSPNVCVWKGLCHKCFKFSMY